MIDPQTGIEQDEEQNFLQTLVGQAGARQAAMEAPLPPQPAPDTGASGSWGAPMTPEEQAALPRPGFENPVIAEAVAKAKAEQQAPPPDPQVAVAEKFLSGGYGGVKSYGQIQREANFQAKSEADQLKEISKSQAEAAKTAQESLKAQSELYKEKSRVENEILAEQKVKEARAADEFEAKKLYMVNAMNTQKAKINEADAMVKKAQEDKTDIFTNADGSRDWGNTIAASIAIALGSFGQALSGQNFNVMGIINDKIARDSAAREKEINALRQTVKDETAIFKDYEKQWDTLEERDLARQMMMHQAAAAQMQRVASTFESPLQAEKLNGMIADQQQQAADKQAQLLNIAGQRADAKATRDIALADRQQAQIAAQQAAAAKQSEKAKQANIRGMQFTGDEPPSQKIVEDLTGARIETRNIVDQIEKLEKHVKKHGGDAWGKSKAEANTMINLLMGAMNRRLKFGAMDAGTQELFSKIMPDPNSYFSGHSLAQLKALKGDLLDGWQNTADQWEYKETELTTGGKHTNSDLQPEDKEVTKRNM